jgi:UDP-N-acetylglucosamine--dolichyl-phosphate N-acetylglucosaminephosphotransferase
MTDYLLILPLLVTFLLVFFLIPFWIKKAHQINLVWNDMNKFKSQKVAGSGGIITVLGFVIGVLLFIAYRVFYVKTTEFVIETFAILTVVLMAAGIGLIDDLLGWQHGGLSRRSRLILMIIAAVPIMVINAGQDSMSLPILGEINFGILYPLFLIPLGVVGATTTFNFLAGFNGLEAGQGVLLIGSLSLVAFFTHSPWLAIIGLCMTFALLAFIKYNFTPAKVFPGDVFTYSVGSIIAIMAVIGNFEKVAVFFFIPYIIETILKSRGGLVKQSFGQPQKDGSLELRYPKVYGLTHLSIYIMQKFGVKPTEKRVVYTIWTFQALIIVAGLWIFRTGIF